MAGHEYCSDPKYIQILQEQLKLVTLHLHYFLPFKLQFIMNVLLG